MVAQPLVIKDEVSNFIRKLLALPSAFLVASLLTFAFGSGRLGCPNRIGSRA